MSRRILSIGFAVPVFAAPLIARAAEPLPVSPSPSPSPSSSASSSSPVASRHAELVDVAFLPTLVVEGGVKRLPTSREPELLMMTSSIDALLADAAQDLGFTVDLTFHAPADVARLGESDLVAQAKAMGGVLISPSIEARASGDVELRLVLADARSRALRVRVELVPS